jgi:hypothetical protein
VPLTAATAYFAPTKFATFSSASVTNLPTEDSKVESIISEKNLQAN